MKKNISKKDIAIIGISGKFPKSDNITEFWNNLDKGKEGVHFYSNEELEELGVPAEQLNNEDYVNADALINDSDTFDNLFFGYTAQEARVMDPQIRHGLEQTWLSLEDAGCNPKTYKGKIGLFMGASDNLNWRVHAHVTGSKYINPFLLKQISDKDQIATLISYKLDLRGPSMYINTSCSSSMVALHTACRSLLFRECTVAIAGGVSIRTDKAIGYQFEEGMINSKDGHCKPFDADASGTLRGEGIGMVVLKRLEEAIKDKDQIYAVIKASASNNDGSNKIGYTAPSIDGQATCIQHAYRVAGIDSKTVSYIEAHGTGTKLGDPIEIAALNKVFKNSEKDSCYVGSIKSNIGHLDAAAGVTSLIKTALALKNKRIPASLNYEQPNPEIPFNEGPFKVVTKSLDWKSELDNPLRAGVSSFGIGGTNVHVLMEESPVSEQKSPQTRPFNLIPFSAKTKDGLIEYQTSLSDFLKNDRVDFQNFCHTIQTGRAAFEYRGFVLAENAKTAQFQLDNQDLVKTNVVKGNKEVYFMFPGQGSQYFKMGFELYQKESFFKEIMDEGFAILQKLTGENHKDLIYGVEATSKINETEYTQPILFLFEYALAKTFLSWGIKPSKMIGHSLGEYVAASIAGVFSFEDAIGLVVLRGNLMKKVGRGAMMGINASIETITPLLTNAIDIAAINSPKTVVVSGLINQIEAFKTVLAEKAIDAAMLKTSHAFHSRIMDPILSEYKAALDVITMNAPTIPIISCLDGEVLTSDKAVSSQYWVQQLREAVNFSKGLEALLQEDNKIFLEVGAGNTLNKFFKQQDSQKENIVLNTVRHAKREISDYALLMDRIGALWLNGVNINWASFSDDSGSKISIPTYPFEKNKYPVKVDPFDAFKAIEFQKDVELKIQPAIAKERTILSNDNPKSKHAIIEQELIELWQAFFGVEEIKLTDDFFDLGGDSLKAITMGNRIYELYNVKLKPEDYYKYSKIKDLAREIKNVQQVLAMKELTQENSNTNEITI